MVNIIRSDGANNGICLKTDTLTVTGATLGYSNGFKMCFVIGN